MIFFRHNDHDDDNDDDHNNDDNTNDANIDDDDNDNDLFLGVPSSAVFYFPKWKRSFGSHDNWSPKTELETYLLLGTHLCECVSVSAWV